MKVLASTLAGLALGQGMRDQGEDRWTGFDYDYGFGTAERNQISQSNTINTAYAQGAGMQTDGSALTAAGELGALFNPYLTSTPANHAANQIGNIAYPTYLGNGMMCWYCDAESVYDCFNAGQFQVKGCKMDCEKLRICEIAKNFDFAKLQKIAILRNCEKLQICEKLRICEIANCDCEKIAISQQFIFLSAGCYCNITQFHFLEGRNCEIAKSMKNTIFVPRTRQFWKCFEKI